MSQVAVAGESALRGTRALRAPVRVMLLNRQRLFHACVEVLVRNEADLEFIGGFASLDGITSSIDVLQPDVILADFDLVQNGVAEFLSWIKQAAPRCHIIMLADVGESGQIQTAMNAGAGGCVLKMASSGELMEAVRLVASGQQFLCAGAMRTGALASRKCSAEESVGSAPVMTTRERELLNYVVAGNSNKLTARKLGVSPKTVSKLRANLMRKLNLTHVSGLARFAYRHGLAR